MPRFLEHAYIEVLRHKHGLCLEEPFGDGHDGHGPRSTLNQAQVPPRTIDLDHFFYMRDGQNAPKPKHCICWYALYGKNNT